MHLVKPSLDASVEAGCVIVILQPHQCVRRPALALVAAMWSALYLCELQWNMENWQEDRLQASRALRQCSVSYSVILFRLVLGNNIPWECLKDI